MGVVVLHAPECISPRVTWFSGRKGEEGVRLHQMGRDALKQIKRRSPISLEMHKLAIPSVLKCSYWQCNTEDLAV